MFRQCFLVSRDIAFKLVTGIIFINPFIYPLSTTKSFSISMALT